MLGQGGQPPFLAALASAAGTAAARTGSVALLPPCRPCRGPRQRRVGNFFVPLGTLPKRCFVIPPMRTRSLTHFFLPRLGGDSEKNEPLLTKKLPYPPSSGPRGFAPRAPPRPLAKSRSIMVVWASAPPTRLCLDRHGCRPAPVATSAPEQPKSSRPLASGSQLPLRFRLSAPLLLSVSPASLASLGRAAPRTRAVALVRHPLARWPASAWSARSAGGRWPAARRRSVGSRDCRRAGRGLARLAARL